MANKAWNIYFLDRYRKKKKKTCWSTLIYITATPFFLFDVQNQTIWHFVTYNWFHSHWYIPLMNISVYHLPYPNLKECLQQRNLLAPSKFGDNIITWSCIPVNLFTECYPARFWMPFVSTQTKSPRDRCVLFSSFCRMVKWETLTFGSERPGLHFRVNKFLTVWLLASYKPH